MAPEGNIVPPGVGLQRKISRVSLFSKVPEEARETDEKQVY